MASYLRNILLVAEPQGNGIAEISAQLVSAAQGLTPGEGWRIMAVLPGPAAEAAAAQLARRGPERVYVLEAAGGEPSTPEDLLPGLLDLIQECKADLVLLGADEFGADLAARLAAHLETGLLTELVDLSLDPDDGAVVGSYHGFEGALICQAKFSGLGPGIATIKPRAFLPAQAGEEACPVQRVPAGAPAATDRIGRPRILPPPEILPELETAQVVVAGGRGAGGTEGFAMLRDLARALGAALGCTRPPVEQGWMDAELMIGTTGKRVQPRLYIGCGIHGDAYHTGGMDQAENIVVLNNDPKAPFFEIATLGIVGDMHQVLPRVLGLLEADKDQQAQGGH